MQVSLGPGGFLLDGSQLPSEKGDRTPNFGPMFLVAKRLDGLRWHLAQRWASVQVITSTSTIQIYVCPKANI